MTGLKGFSPKQRLAVRWWCLPRYSDCDAIICDGSVRSGKTLAMSLGFVLWASSCFDGGSFAICGKTVTSLRRNVIAPLITLLCSYGFQCDERVSRSYFDVCFGGRKNRFYLFGGKDEGSSALIQGITLCGILLDEVALMPRSFVEQGIARCSVKGSRLWFNCNPENPSHWFYTEWIQRAEEKRALCLHFTMKDNPSLSDEIRERYERLYSGVFYERFVLGRWVASSGLIYPMFDKTRHVFAEPPECTRFIISCDYGTVNPSSFGLWGQSGSVWYRIKEYYYSSRSEGSLRTDEEQYAELEKLAGERYIEKVIVDPSAASFIECIRRHGRFAVSGAKNDVVSGIRRVSDCLMQNGIVFSQSCLDTLREFSLYCWNDKCGSDAPLKVNDHAMDDIRYFVSEVFGGAPDDFYVASLSRDSRR